MLFSPWVLLDEHMLINHLLDTGCLQMLILQKVSEDKEFRERDLLKLENEQKEAGGTNFVLHF